LFLVAFTVVAPVFSQTTWWILNFLQEIVNSPWTLFETLSNTLPSCTHFYMNYIITQWLNHSWQLLRIMPVTKYMTFREFYPLEKARQMSEPEDQDYWGIGSRSARLSVEMMIGIIFSTMSPAIAMLTFINFGVCRVCFGYLIPFAETKKPDLGGEFYAKQLRHLFHGLLMYTIVMAFYVYAQAGDDKLIEVQQHAFSHAHVSLPFMSLPALIAWFAVVFVLVAWRRFEKVKWRSVPFPAVVKYTSSEATRPPVLETFIQPELTEESSRPTGTKELTDRF